MFFRNPDVVFYLTNVVRLIGSDPVEVVMRFPVEMHVTKVDERIRSTWFTALCPSRPEGQRDDLQTERRRPDQSSSAYQ